MMQAASIPFAIKHAFLSYSVIVLSPASILAHVVLTTILAKLLVFESAELTPVT